MDPKTGFTNGVFLNTAKHCIKIPFYNPGLTVDDVNTMVYQRANKSWFSKLHNTTPL